MYTKITAALILGVVCCTIGLPASGNTLGPLEPVLVQGESDGWTGSTDRGAYWLENPAAQGAIRYFYAPYVDGSGGKRNFSIDVDVSNTAADARAGLLYGYQGNPVRYFMLLIGRGGQIEFYRRDESGVQQMMASTAKIVSGFNRVEIREDGRKVDLFVNGEGMGSIETNGTGKGSLGIAAMGIGRFGFTSYAERSTSGWLD